MRSPEALRLTRCLAALCAGGSLIAGVPAWAHHSFAMFDRTKSVTLDGVVKEWQFTNPHTWVQIVVMEGGLPVEYGVEGPSVNTLVRVGWSPTTFKPGDKVQIIMNPLRDGTKGGAFVKAILPNGKVLTAGQTPG
jgi:hypothetical protein